MPVTSSLLYPFFVDVSFPIWLLDELNEYFFQTHFLILLHANSTFSVINTIGTRCIWAIIEFALEIGFGNGYDVIKVPWIVSRRDQFQWIVCHSVEVLATKGLGPKRATLVIGSSRVDLYFGIISSNKLITYEGNGISSRMLSCLNYLPIFEIIKKGATNSTTTINSTQRYPSCSP